MHKTCFKYLEKIYHFLAIITKPVWNFKLCPKHYFVPKYLTWFSLKLKQFEIVKVLNIWNQKVQKINEYDLENKEIINK